MGLVRVTDGNRSKFLPLILELESEAEYPLGNDFFKIDHGQDYFKFFHRLGSTYYYAWVEGEQVAAVAAGVLRNVPFKAWYLSDLKVQKKFRGQRIPLRMLSRAFLSNYLRCQRGYAISMNAPGDKSNRVARLLEHFRWAPLKVSSQLLLWSLSEDEIKSLIPILVKHRGPVGFLSLKGIKDIVLKSTHQPMPLVHVQFGPLADQKASRETVAGGVHMFCSPAGDPLNQEILAKGFAPSSTASVIAHRMKQNDWSWILTSDI